MNLIGFLYVSLFVNECFSIKVYFESCDKHGFTCQNSTIYKDKQDITYQCVDDSLDGITLDFWIWDFSPLLQIGTLTIADCHTLRLRFGCGENLDRRIQILYVHHVFDLSIYEDQVVCNPTSVIFESIELLRTIPRNTFSQIQSLCNASDCTLNKLVLDNVNIGTIQTNAIELINNVQLFRIANVVVKNINTGGIKILNNKDASIYFLNSVIDSLDTLAMQIHANKFTIGTSTFNLLSYSSINATLHTFEFSANSVTSVLTAAFTVQSQNVIFLKNHFQNVNTGAFQKITAVDDQMFSYKFVDNVIANPNVASLHPSLPPSSSSSDLIFTNNKFSCSCDEYLWFSRGMIFGRGLKYAEPFYEHVLDSKNNNTCVFRSCILPLRSMKGLTPSSKICQQPSLQSEIDFCDSYDFDENTSVRLFNIVWFNIFCYIFIVYF